MVSIRHCKPQGGEAIQQRGRIERRTGLLRQSPAFSQVIPIEK
jgi:hypothetical protein